jgi:Tol biopolymer transport system component
LAGGISPKWSPDGSKIAYCGVSPSPVYIMNSDGTDAKEIPGIWGSEVAWSPDGARIAFTNLTYDSIFITTTDGSNVVKLTPGIKPCWSLDGLEIYFQNSNVCWSIKLSDHTIRKLFDAPYPGVTFHWSPDRTKIIYTHSGPDYNIYVMKADGSDPKAITDFSENEGLSGYCWSPDGTKIAFSTSTGVGEYGLYVMNQDGSDRQTFTKFTDPVDVEDWH